MLAHKGCVREARDVFAQVRGGEERGGEAREGEERRGEGRGGEGRKGEQIGLWGTVFHSWPNHPPIQALCCCQDLRRGKKIGLRGGCAIYTSSPSFAIAKVCRW